MITYAQASALSVSGTWNATTNRVSTPRVIGLYDYYTPAEAIYAVSVAGSTMLGGVNTWNVGDYAYCDGVRWSRIQNLADAVATSTTAGTVKPDNVTTFVDSNGVISAVGGGGGGYTDNVIVSPSYTPINGEVVAVGQTVTTALGALQGQILANATPILTNVDMNVATAGMVQSTGYMYVNVGASIITLTLQGGGVFISPLVLNGSATTMGLNPGEVATLSKQPNGSILIS